MPSWSTANLARLVGRLQGVRVTDECTRRHLHRPDFVCRRPTWTVQHLARLQPGDAQKKGHYQAVARAPAGCRRRRAGRSGLGLSPTLTRRGTPRGQQKKVPGAHPPRRRERAATDWRTGDIVRVRGEKRDAVTFCRLSEACRVCPARRKQRVIVVTDRAKIHTLEGSRPVRAPLRRCGKRLEWRYVPLYAPDYQPCPSLPGKLRPYK